MRQLNLTEALGGEIHYEILRQIFYASPYGIRIVDNKYRVIDANPAYIRNFNLGTDVVGAKCYQSGVGNLCFSPLCTLAQIQKGSEVVQMEVDKVRQDGTKMPCLLTATPIKDSKGKVAGIVEHFQDITEQKATMGELLQNHRRNDALFAASPVGFFEVNEAGICVYVNEQTCRMCGRSAEEILAHGWEKAIHPSDREKVLDDWLDCIEKKKPFKKEYRFLRPDGSVTWTIGQAVPYQALDGTLWYVGTLSDITEIKQVEKSLRDSEAKFRSYVDKAPDGVFIVDEDAQNVDVNPAGCNMLGYTREELLQLSIRDLSENTMGSFEQLRTTGDFEEERLLRKKDGSYLMAELKAAALNDDRFIGFVRDITERKKAEEHFLKMEKLESLGLLAGGIAHDFNNILTVISGNIALAAMRLDADEQDVIKAKELLKEAEKASLQVRGLTQQLLTFAKGGEPILETVSLGALLADTVNFVLRGSKVKPKLEIADELWPATIDSGQINQAISNLLINACQAMPQGGQIDIRAENITLNEEEIISLAQGNYVKISIKDQGIGIQEEYMDKIFDPYFTTKQAGSGLGLATTFSIVEKHKGYIGVTSELGVGTEFHIYLPAAANGIQEENGKEDMPFAGTGKILVMDDEQLVRETIIEILCHLGYQAIGAQDGSEALDLYQKAQDNNQPFDVVIMDLTIPGGMGGKESIRHLLKVNKDAKAIVASGYSNDQVLANYQDYGFKGMVSKPFDVKQLRNSLRSVMGE